MRRRPFLPDRARPLRRLAAATALLLAAACGGGDGGTGPGGAAGRYDIVQVNDDTTSPFTLLEGTAEGFAVRVEVLGGSIDLRSNGSYSSVATARVLVNGISQGEQSSPQTGRYEVSGTTVTFDPAGSDPEEPNYTGTLEGNTLTLTETDENPFTGEPVTITIVARR